MAGKLRRIRRQHGAENGRGPLPHQHGLGLPQCLLGRHELRKRGRNTRPGRQRTRYHRSRMLFAPGDPEHDPFDRTGHQGRSDSETATCVSKLTKTRKAKANG